MQDEDGDNAGADEDVRDNESYGYDVYSIPNNAPIPEVMQGQENKKMHATTSSKHHLPIGSSKVHEQTGGCNYNPSKPQPLCPPTLPVVHGRIDLPLLGPLEAVCPKDHIVHDEVKPKEEVQKHWRAAPRHITQEPCPGLFKAVIGEPSLKTNTEQHLYKHDWVGKQ